MNLGTVSQDGQGWKGSLDVTLLNCVPKQVHLDLIEKDCVQMAFEHFQGQRLHNNPEQPVPVLSCLHCGKNVS